MEKKVTKVLALLLYIAFSLVSCKSGISTVTLTFDSEGGDCPKSLK